MKYVFFFIAAFISHNLFSQATTTAHPYVKGTWLAGGMLRLDGMFQQNRVRWGNQPNRTSQGYQQSVRLNPNVQYFFSDRWAVLAGVDLTGAYFQQPASEATRNSHSVGLNAVIRQYFPIRGIAGAAFFHELGGGYSYRLDVNKSTSPLGVQRSSQYTQSIHADYKIGGAIFLHPRLQFVATVASVQFDQSRFGRNASQWAGAYFNLRQLSFSFNYRLNR